MRKLKLQVQMTIDGFVAGPNGELDWMIFGPDEEGVVVVNEWTDSSDTILLGRKMIDGFMNYWESVLEKPESPEYSFAEKMVGYQKFVFSRTLEESIWKNTTLIRGELVAAVNEIKNREGKDILVYGGANFVSNLVKENLIDEYNLVINPAAIGKGLTIFSSLENTMRLQLIKSQSFSNGKVANTYLPQK